MQTALGSGALAVLSTGCFTTSADFRTDAERYIRTNDRLREALLADGEIFTEVACDQPASRAVGETFPCRATDTTGAAWEFAVEITGTTDYQVTVSRAP